MIRPSGDDLTELVEKVAEVMHDAYEAAAVAEDWQTNPASRVAWEYVPEANKRTMRVAVRAAIAAIRAEDACVCNVGVQECPVHPGRLMDQEEKVAFRKAWDARVDAGRTPVHLGPEGDDSRTRCCGRLVFDLPLTDRMTYDEKSVTCKEER